MTKIHSPALTSLCSLTQQAIDGTLEAFAITTVNAQGQVVTCHYAREAYHVILVGGLSIMMADVVASREQFKPKAPVGEASEGEASAPMPEPSHLLKQ